MSQAPVLLRLVANSVKIAHRAGELIRDIMRKGELGIVTKGKMDFQTEADRAAQRCIMASLYKNFPKVSIYGEEEEDPNNPIPPDWLELSYDEKVLSPEMMAKLPANLKAVKDEECVVWVDPVDGTAEYTQGLLDHVTVLIGIAVNGVATAGVIYQPYYNYQAGPDAPLGRAIWGIVGLGGFGFSAVKAPAEQNIITTTRSHTTKVVTDAIEACEPTEVMKVGGAGHKVLLLIEGKAHAYVFASPGCKKWDTCAPEAVLQAVGGKLTDIHGNTYQYHGSVQRRNTGGVLATQEADKHAWYLERIPAECKDTLPVD
jgi:3'(2'), 5'-bisphosphate nucleotidase